MKKVKMIIMLGVCLLLVTGCGGKYKVEPKEYGEDIQVLSCDLPLEEEGEQPDAEVLSSKVKFAYNTKTNKIEDTRYEMQYDYNDAIKEAEGSKFATILLEWGLDVVCESMEQEGYNGCSYSEKNGIYTFVMSMGSTDKLDGVEMDTINPSSINDVKTFIEGTDAFKGQTCTIE